MNIIVYSQYNILNFLEGRRSECFSVEIMNFCVGSMDFQELLVH